MLLGRKLGLSSSTTSPPSASTLAGQGQGALSLSSEDERVAPIASRFLRPSAAPTATEQTRLPPVPPSSRAVDHNGHHSRDDRDSIAETNSFISNSKGANLNQQQQQQQQQSNQQNPNPALSEREVEEDFDPALLNVLSSGESDVHSLLSAPGDLSSHRDPLASLGLTPLSHSLARRDKAAQILGIPHRKSMEPIPSPSAPYGMQYTNTSNNNNTSSRAGRFSSFGSRSATGGYTNPHATIPESGQHGHELDIHDYRHSTQGRHRAMSGATTNTQLGARHGLGVSGPVGRDGPLTSLYLVAGLPKSHHAWTLADPDSVLGLQHSDGAVGRWWRPEVLGSTVSPGVAPGSKDKDGATGAPKAPASSAASVDTRKRRKSSNATIPSNMPGANGASGGAGANGAVNLRDPGAAIGMSKPQVAKMLSKALKLSFTREVEIIASTLQPASTVHSFTFSLPTPAGDNLDTTGGGGVGGARSAVDVRSSVYSAPNGRGTMSGIVGGPGAMGGGGMGMLASARPSSTYLGPTTTPLTPAAQEAMQAEAASSTTFYGVCLTVWSHADEERSKAIRRTVEMRGGASFAPGGGAGGGSVRRRRKRTESSRAGKEKIPPVPSLPGVNGQTLAANAATRSVRTSNPDAPAWSGTDAELETEPDMDQDEYDEDGLYIDDGTDTGGVSESDWEGRKSRSRAEMGDSTLFLGGDTIFWLPYALTLVSRVPIYDLMRDFLTFSWARFSKDVHSHTLQV